MGYLYQLCENCIFADEPSDKEPCRKCIRAFLAARTHKPQTNADRIRCMSDEELEAEFWRIYEELRRWTNSRIWLHQWLMEEVKE